MTKKKKEDQRQLLFEMACEVFGHPARLLSGSKSAYRTRFPEHKVVFNGNLCTKEYGKIWYGDIDVTLDAEKLDVLAEKIGVDIYVLYEMDGRFENEDKPVFDSPVYVAKAK